MYQLTETPSIKRLSDGASIPADPANRDYASYLEWLSAGNTPEPADPLPSKRPSEITARLAQIDAESVRPLRAMIAETATAADAARLLDLDAEAASLRIELSALK